MVLSAQELERYARHIVLQDVGGAGQQKIKAAKVLAIGAGGLGSPLLQYLAAAGIGTIGIVDDDVVSLSNLQRQIIHDTNKIDQPKTTSAKEALNRINPHVEITEHMQRLTNKNAEAIISNYDIVADGCDNFETRYLVADTCEALEKTLVSAAVGQFDGSLTTFIPHLKNDTGKQNPRYRDIFPSAPPQGLLPSCQEAGILGAITGVIGTMQALEVIKEITGIGEGLVGKLQLFDGKAMRFETIKYLRKD